MISKNDYLMISSNLYFLLAMLLLGIALSGCISVGVVDGSIDAKGNKIKTPDELMEMTADDMRYGVGNTSTEFDGSVDIQHKTVLSTEVTDEHLKRHHEVFYLVDSSGSNKYRDEVAAEIIGHYGKKLEDEDYACVIQIASDSLSTDTRLWCREPVRQTQCAKPLVKENNFSNTREEAAYVEATAHIETLLTECEEAIVDEEAERRFRYQVEISKFFNGLESTSHTDIEGAFGKVQEKYRCKECGVEIFVWSDMEEDPLHSRTEPLKIFLNNVPVHVREIKKSGKGYSEARKNQWVAKFSEWGTTEVDWKGYDVGEFGTVGETYTPHRSSGSRTASKPPKATTPEPSATAREVDDEGFVRLGGKKR